MSLQAALEYAALGLPVFPVHGIRTLPDGTNLCTCGRPACPHPGKHPACAHGFLDATTDPDTLRALFPDDPNQPRNLGLPTGTASGLVVVDVDPRNFPPSTGTDPFQELLTLVPDLATPTRTASTPGDGTTHGTHLYYRIPSVIPIKTIPNFRPGIDLKADGGYVILPPSQTLNGTYEFTTPPTLPAQPLPPDLLLVPRAPASPGTPGTSTGTGLTPAAIEAILADPTQLQPGQRDLFFFAAARDLRRERGLTYQQTLAALTHVYNNMHNPPHDHFPLTAVHAKIANAYQDPDQAHNPAPTPATQIPASLLPVPTQTTTTTPTPPPSDTIRTTSRDILQSGGWDGRWPDNPPDPQVTLTPVGVANLLQRAAGHRIRYVPASGSWYVCDPTTNLWATSSNPDEVLKSRTHLIGLVEDYLFILRTHATQHLQPSDAQELTNWLLRHNTPQFTDTIIKVLEGRDELAISHADFNPPHLLPVQNGVLDLSGWETSLVEDGVPYHFTDFEEEAAYNLVTRHRFRAARPEDLLTSTTNFTFNPEDVIYGQRHLQEWDDLLRGWFPNPDIRQYVQRLLGYAVFGNADQKLFVVAHGRPNSGKSAFFNNLQRLLDRYAVTIPSTGIVTLRGRVSDERNLAFAFAHGTKLLIASETPPDARFNLDVLKAVTGGDPIIVRRMGENGVALTNHGTLILMTNHMPANDSLDDALWKRLVVLPFENEFPPNTPGTITPTRLAKLLDEYSFEVLNWLVRGYTSFLRGGLRAPEALDLAKLEVQEDQDWLGQFLSDHVQPTEEDVPPLEFLAIYEMYKAWSHVNQEEPAGYKRVFAPALRERLREHVKRSPARRWTLYGHRLVTGPPAQ